MSVERFNSAIMQLRGKALEVYGLIKDIHRRPAEEGDVDKIMNLSVKLAQLEGGLVTLEQYAPEIMTQVAEESPAPEAEVEEEPPSKETIGHEELMKRSSTYRKSVEQQEAREASKKKTKS